MLKKIINKFVFINFFQCKSLRYSPHSIICPLEFPESVHVCDDFSCQSAVCYLVYSQVSVALFICHLNL